MGVPIKSRKSNKKSRGGKSHNNSRRHMRRNKTHNKTHNKKRRQHKKTRKHIQRGGWNLGNIMANLPLGQDIVNVGRSIGNGVSNLGRGFKGVHTTRSQWPTSDQFPNSSMKFTKPIHVSKIYKNNKASVKGIGPS